jgi:ABC-type uncharacterized transport system permease subunit
MRVLRLLFVFVRVGVMSELAYRANFFVQLFESLLELGTALAGMAVIFSHTATLGGWRPDEILALVGVYFLVGGAIRLLIQPSMEQLIESVHDGTLDFTLTKPEDAQLLVSLQRVEIWKLTDIVLGFGVLAVALARLGTRVGVRQAAAFGAALLAGGVIVYSFWLILATLSFWVHKGRKHTDDLPEHVRGRPLAGEPLPGVAALLYDLPYSRRLRHDHPRPGPGRPPDLADPPRRGGFGRSAVCRLAFVLAGGNQALFGRFSLGGRSTFH